MSKHSSASGKDKSARVVLHPCQSSSSSACSPQQTRAWAQTALPSTNSDASPSSSQACQSSSTSSLVSAPNQATSSTRPQTSWASLLTTSPPPTQPPLATSNPSITPTPLNEVKKLPVGPSSDSLSSITPTKAAVSNNSWASLLGGSNVSQQTNAIAKPSGSDGSGNSNSGISGSVTHGSVKTSDANGIGEKRSGPIVGSAAGSKNSKLKVEITFRPDRELKQPEGCEWLERRTEIIDLSWDWMYLKTFLEDTVRRHLSEREQQTWMHLPATKRPVSRAETIRVWGIRAVGVDIQQRDGRKDVQLYDREQKWKVDMSWESFLQRLPSHKRVNVGEKPAWTLYLAYDMGVSLHRDLRGKPKALLA